jgi:hypothetical protein
MTTTNAHRILTTDEVNIQAVSIDVQVIRIGKRQMTLAVLRQLRQEFLVDPETLELLGKPWGLVNVHNKNCRPPDLHHHVLWQKDGELRLCAIDVCWWHNDGLLDLYESQFSNVVIRSEDWVRVIGVSPRKEKEDARRAEAEAEYERLKQGWEVCYGELAALDQLFIAV